MQTPGREILDLDLKRVAAMVARDTATLESLLADDLTYTHSGGYTDTKASFVSFIRDQGNYEAVDFPEARPTVLSSDAVMVRGIARIKLTGIPAYDVIFSDLWTRDASGWRLRLWHATRLKPAS